MFVHKTHKKKIQAYFQISKNTNKTNLFSDDDNKIKFHVYN